MNINITILVSFKEMAKIDLNELEVLRVVFGENNVVEHFYEIPEGSIVVPRYRAIPFGKLTEEEVSHRRAQLINTYHQHRNIADSTNWSPLLDGTDENKQLTARQYFVEDIPRLPENQYFVKGETNSLKNNWAKSSFAPSKKDLVEVVNNFMSDGYVGTQRVVIKPFQKFRQLETAVNGQPIFNERRAFVLDGELLADGFYWSSWAEELGEVEYDRGSFMKTLNEVVKRVSHLSRFFVIDLAENQDGSWWVVELNDGPMSGLSCVDPFELWTNFKNAFQ